MKSKCLICERISAIKENKNPCFVKELETGYVVLGDFQFYKGYTLFLCKKHVQELHELNPEFKSKFLNEMSLVSEAVFKAFKPLKLNYELLGNSESHLHWHIFPRHLNDPNPKNPVWIIDKKVRYAPETKPNQKELEEMKKTLLKELI
ncbi:MAG: HIT family protein [Candidatus Nanoarchaeia archaeon]|nr:HIT family protein [Candidatus Nanoarchaeia archaeon]